MASARGAGGTLEVTGSDGVRFTLSGARFEPDWKLAGERDGAPVTLKVDELLGLTPVGRGAAPIKGPTVHLASGEILCGEVIRAEEEKLRVRGALFGEIDLPISAVSAILLQAEAAESLTRLTRQAAQAQGDRVMLKNGDELGGTFRGADPERVLLDRDGDEAELARGLVAAVVLDPSLAEYEPPTEFFVQTRLVDGSVIHAAALQSEDAHLRLSTRFGATLAVEESAVADLSPRNGRVLYLSDIEPVRAMARAFLDGALPWRRDRSLLGEPLRVGGRTFEKGLGVGSYSELLFAPGGFERFEATVALDEAAGPEASVRFRVRVDGKEVFDSGEMLATSTPQNVSVPVAGAGELALVVEFESRGDVQDYADWCDARLVR